MWVRAMSLVGTEVELRAEGAGDGAVGADEGARRGRRLERAEDAHGVGVAAAGGDDDLGAGGLGELERGEVARADVAFGVEQGSIQVDGDEAGVHGSTLREGR
jgi:hypothetical protein